MTRGTKPLSVLIVASNVSARFGGEAVLPLHYFRFLRERGVDVRMLTHERTRVELQVSLGPDFQRVTFLPDVALNKVLVQLGSWLPDQISDFTLLTLNQWYDELRQRPVARRLVRDHGVDVIHVPTPVSPRLPSFLYGLGAPVIFGPMNGGMEYPPGYRFGVRRLEGLLINALRIISPAMNWLIPGKRKACLLLVANDRTRETLPASLRGREVSTLPENGVDLALFGVESQQVRQAGPLRIAFVGRLIGWKRVDLLVSACLRASKEICLTLDIVGDGQSLEDLRLQATPLGDRITFHGAVNQTEVARILGSCDVLVLPSMRECGGAVVLEAMAMGKPVVATNWGGPADYLDASCGILIDPQTPEAFVQDLTSALIELAKSPDFGRGLGTAGRRRVKKEFDWRSKVERMLSIYETVACKYNREHLAELGRTTPA